MALNCKNNILTNKEVRQAINSAINKETILKDISNGKYQVSNFPLDFGSFSYDKNNEVMGYDTNTAKRLLVENGWKYSSRRWTNTVNYRYLKIELNLVVDKTENSMVKIANNIKEQLNSVGIIINVKEVSKGTQIFFILKSIYLKNILSNLKTKANF